MFRRPILFFVTFLFLTLTISLHSQQISGRLMDAKTEEPLPGVLITLYPTTKTVYTNGSGNFRFLNVEAGSYELKVSHGSELITLQSVLMGDDDNLLGSIPVDFLSSFVAATEITVIDVTDLSGIESENDNFSSLLTAGRDVFSNSAAFNLSSGRFRPRGYFNEDSEMIMNGMVMNDQDDGRVLWTAWSGLNDVMRGQTLALNLASNDYTFGGVGGATFVDLRAGSQRAQTRISYSNSNRTYQHRLMVSHGSGMIKNGWAYSAAVSHRYADSGYMPGTYMQGTSYFLSVDKKLSASHTLNFVTFGTPQRRGRSTGSFQELYDLTDDNYYNPNWGLQNGEVRNSREYRINQPVAMLRHDWKVGAKTNVLTTLGVQWGTFGSTRLDWFEAPDPRPDYYRKLPSFSTNPQTADLIRAAYINDINVRQVDWAGLYAANQTRFLSVENANGIAGNTVSGKLAAYIVEEEHFDNQKINFNSIFNTPLTSDIVLTGGIQYLSEKVHNYRKVDDLLGADFYVDFNRFALRDFPDSDAARQNDLNNPNRILKEGDIFGYNFDIVTDKMAAWSQAVYTGRIFDVFGAVNIAQQSFFRRGYTKVGIFPDDSFGDSEKQSFFNYGLKGGFTYKLDGRNYFLVNASYRTRAPFARETYVSPRTRDQLVEGLTNERITSAEVSYNLRYPGLKGRISAFYTDYKDQISSNVFYHDELRTFVNYVMNGINKRHTGIEGGLEAKLNAAFSFTLAGSIGEYYYTSRPTATIARDNSSESLVKDRTVFINNYYVAGSPQSAGTFGINYNNPRFWFVNVNFNLFGNNYLDFNPDRRTSLGVDGINPQEEEELFFKVIDQEKLPGAYTIDVFMGKSWRIGRQYFLNVNLNVANVLNRTDFITGGFEQLRFDYENKDVNRFPPRYFYAFGANYNLNIALRF
ncbi:MAG: TonB-dependent receptor [Saprospiraceae bacterium]|nr:TonB-dependent receptor [Saprospiraceae bacterium]